MFGLNGLRCQGGRVCIGHVQHQDVLQGAVRVDVDPGPNRDRLESRNGRQRLSLHMMQDSSIDDEQYCIRMHTRGASGRSIGKQIEESKVCQGRYTFGRICCHW